MTERGRLRMALTGVILGAAILRLWGLGYGLPHTLARPDEELVVGKSLEVSLGRMSDPGAFPYPHLVFYVDALALAGWRETGILIGAYRDTGEFLVDVAVHHPALHYRICRVVGALFGAATVWAAFLGAFHAYRRRSVALLASLLVGVNYLHARDSHFATVDVPMAFFTTLSIAFALRFVGTRSRTDALASALFAGLATSAKYNAALVILGLAVAATHDLRRRPAEAWRRAAVTLTLAGVVMVLAFALTSPHAALQWHGVVQGLVRQRRVLFGGGGVPAWRIHFLETFPGAFGWPGFVAVIVGLVRAIWKRRPSDLVLLAFVVPVFASMAGMTWVLPRYPLLLVPPLAMMAAEAALSLPGRRAVSLVAAGVLLVLPPLRNVVAYDRLASRDDTRLLAADWVAANVPPRTRIAVCQGYGAPAVNADHRRPPAFKVKEVSCTADAIRETGAPYVITHDHPQVRYFHPSDAVLRWLATEARPVATFDPFRSEGAAGAFFYSGDAFYLPYSGLDAVDRGGPIVTIWRRNDAGP